MKEMTKGFKIRTIVITALVLAVLLLPFAGTIVGTVAKELFFEIALGFGAMFQVEFLITLAYYLLFVFLAFSAINLVLMIVRMCTKSKGFVKFQKVVSIISAVIMMLSFLVLAIPVVMNLIYGIAEGGIMGILMYCYPFIIWAVLAMWQFVLNIKTAKRS